MKNTGNDSRFPRAALAAAALLACASAILVGGCGTSNPYSAGSYERALRYYEAGKHREAADAFGQFLRTSPTDSMAPRAQLLKARSYMALDEYPMAAVELQILNQEYPTSDLLEEAAYLEAEAHFLQVGKVERDISEAYAARDLLRRFLIAYPVSDRSPDARDMLRRISNIVVRKTLSNINVYRQLGKWRSVAIALDRCIAEETESDLRDRLLWERAETARRLDADDEAAGFLRRLIDEHPDSDLVDGARSLLAELETPPGS